MSLARFARPCYGGDVPGKPVVSMARSAADHGVRTPRRYAATTSSEGGRGAGERERDVSAAWASFHAEWSAVVRAWCRKDPRLRGDPLANGWDILVDVFDACYLQGGGAVTEQALRRATNRLSTERRRCLRHEVSLEDIDALAQPISTSRVGPNGGERLLQWQDALLAKLSRNQRIAIERHYLDEVPDREIAREIGCAVASVRVLRRRGILRLRELVGTSPPPRLTACEARERRGVGWSALLRRWPLHGRGTHRDQFTADPVNVMDRNCHDGQGA